MRRACIQNASNAANMSPMRLDRGDYAAVMLCKGYVGSDLQPNYSWALI